MKHNITTIKKAFGMLLRYASSKNYILNATRLHKLREEIDGCEKELREREKGFYETSHWISIEELLRE